VLTGVRSPQPVSAHTATTSNVGTTGPVFVQCKNLDCMEGSLLDSSTQYILRACQTTSHLSRTLFGPPERSETQRRSFPTCSPAAPRGQTSAWWTNRSRQQARVKPAWRAFTLRMSESKRLRSVHLSRAARPTFSSTRALYQDRTTTELQAQLERYPSR